MSRNPSVHIRRSDLVPILEKYKITESEVDDIMLACRQYAVKGRVQVKTNARTKKKVDRLIESDSGYTERFNGVLTTYRKSANHIVTTIRKNSKDWLQLVEIAADAKEFVDAFEIQDMDSGFRSYIKAGIDLMGKKYGLSKFKFYKQRIFDYYEFAKAIETDCDPNGTETFYNVYADTLVKNTGIDIELDHVEDYVHMVFARQEADALGANYQDWVDAQFDGLAFLNAVPEMSQLYGINSQKRYRRYIQKKGLKTKTDDGMPTKYQSEAEEKYWQAIREKRGEK